MKVQTLMARDDYFEENLRGIDRFETEALCDAESDPEIAERVRSKSGDLREPEPQSNNWGSANYKNLPLCPTV